MKGLYTPKQRSNTEHLERDREGPGNTESQGLQHTYWFFTYNNYEIETIERLITIFRHECDWYVCQEEIGEQGTPHIQGTLKLKKRKRLSQLKKFDLAVHWEPTKSVERSLVYCTKQETRAPNGKQWVYGIDIPPDIKIVSLLYPWQLTLFDILKQRPNDRTIHWIWEPVGGVGKTKFAKYLVMKLDALVLSGKMNDMFYAVANMVKAKKPPKIIIIDCPRSMIDYVCYAGLEKLKDGLFFSGKYEGGMCIYECPHVVVFANDQPDISKMSHDRWDIRLIQHNKTLSEPN